MSEFNIEDLHAVIAGADSRLVQMLALQLRKQIGISKASEQQLAAVVAENAGLKAAAEFATAGDMWIEQADGMLDYRYVDWYVDVLKAAMETPETEAMMNEIRAQGVEMFVKNIAAGLRTAGGSWGIFQEPYHEFADHLESNGEEFALQIRQGASK